MRIDSDIQPLGPDRMRERIAELQARAGGDVETFSLPVGASPLQGQIGDEGNGFAPMTVKGFRLAGTASPEMRGMIEKAANENGVDPNLLDALVAAESSYNPNCRSSANAMGLTQLMPGTAKSLGVSNPFDPAQSLDGGARYLAKMIDKYGDLKLALAAYNAGPGAVDKAGGVPPYRETQKYVQKVLGLYNLKRGQ